MFAHSLHRWANINQALYNGLCKCVAHSVYPYPAETRRRPNGFFRVGPPSTTLPNITQQNQKDAYWR